MAPYTSGAYVNYIDADITDWESAYYGTNLARLERVKSDYDPDDVFNGPQSIPHVPLRRYSGVEMVSFRAHEESRRLLPSAGLDEILRASG